jgi:flagellar biosynthesis/type III secretory pathway protein FliH
MVMQVNRVIRGVPAGVAIGADEIGRFLSPQQRAVLVARLSDEANARAAVLIADARTEAERILAEAFREAEAVRAQAREEGFATGHADGHAALLAEMEPVALLLQNAAQDALAIRAALLDGVEQQAVAAAMAAARRVVGELADAQSDLAAQVVHNGLRAAGRRVLRIRVHPDDAEMVKVSLLPQDEAALVEPDRAVEVGGCIIDVEGGAIDLRLGVQLASIAGAWLMEGGGAEDAA